MRHVRLGALEKELGAWNCGDTWCPNAKAFPLADEYGVEQISGPVLAPIPAPETVTTRAAPAPPINDQDQ